MTSKPFANAPDHGWLQGRVEETRNGQLLLRYVDPAATDVRAAAVLLEGDDRLGQIRTGDVIRVQGEYLPEDGQNEPVTWPAYRVQEIWLIQRAQ